jgi:signal transduction histidine kinase
MARQVRLPTLHDGTSPEDRERMTRARTAVSRGYQVALRSHLERPDEAGLEGARGLGGEALAAGLPTLDLARLHEAMVIAVLPVDCPADRREVLIGKAARFFAVAILPVVPADPAADGSAARLEELIATLSRRTLELAAANLGLEREIHCREQGETALRESEGQLAIALERSDRQQDQLRHLARRLLATQEEERRKISRELHDVIAQTLAGIHHRLEALQGEAARGAAELDRHLDGTQELVRQAMATVQSFARELRPAVLDELGLAPALASLLEIFSRRSGIRGRLAIDPDLPPLDALPRTVLYRVAQEALANVTKHAQASSVVLAVEEAMDEIVMTVSDDGGGFDPGEAETRSGGRHLGLLGMRERLEMIGGVFRIDSTPGRGTVIHARIPCPVSLEP